MFDHTTLVELLSNQASKRPDQLAYRFLAKGEIVGESSSYTFGRLAVRARAVGSWLLENGYAGQRALLLFPPGLDFIESFLGCLCAGVIAVPAFPPRSDRTLPRLTAMVASAKPALILATDSIARSTRGLERATDLTALRWQVSSEIPDSLARHWSDPGVTAESIAFLQYTSGSTGSPKGVMVSHRNLLANQRAIVDAMRHTPEDLQGWSGDLFVSWLPLQHDMGLIGPMLQGLYIGGTTTLMSPLHFLQKPMRWLQAISHYRAHTSGGPNFAYDLCVGKVQANPALLEGLDLSCWKTAFNGAEPVRWETLQRFAQTFAPCGFRLESFVPCYGMAETTLLVSGRRDRPLPAVLETDPDALMCGRAEPNPSGRALVGCGRSDEVVKIVDPQSRAECADSEIGEIWIHGPSVAQGYWQNAEASAQTFGATLRGEEQARRTYLRSGDLGFVRGRDLFITGRLKDLLV
ncbi:MAG TPA: fatty acyl-AMP ligase, partial [Polyangiales bacterium]